MSDTATSAPRDIFDQVHSSLGAKSIGHTLGVRLEKHKDGHEEVPEEEERWSVGQRNDARSLVVWTTQHKKLTLSLAPKLI